MDYDEKRAALGQYFMDEMLEGRSMGQAAKLTARYMLDLVETEMRDLYGMRHHADIKEHIDYQVEMKAIAQALVEAIVLAGDYREVIAARLGSLLERYTAAYRATKPLKVSA